MAIFFDDDNAGYLIAAANKPGQGANATMYIFRMTDDYSGVTEIVTTLFEDQYREFPNLIKKDVPGIISVIERSDDETKLLYVKSLNSLALNSQSTYQQDSLEYRIIKLAASNDQSIASIRSVITVNGVKLKAINIKDQVSITYNGVSHSFLLTEIIPAYSSPVSLSALASQFNSIEKASEIFAVEEMPASEAMNIILQYYIDIYLKHNY